MLLKDLYSFSILSVDNEEIKAKIEINKNSRIYKGHFPQMPVTPGVCQVLIIKEVVSKVLNKSLMLTESGNIKFLSMHNPAETVGLLLTINYKCISEDDISVTGLLYSNNTKYLKFDGVFRST